MSEEHKWVHISHNYSALSSWVCYTTNFELVRVKCVLSYDTHFHNEDKFTSYWHIVFLIHYRVILFYNTSLLLWAMTLDKGYCPITGGCHFVELLGTNSKFGVLGFSKFLIWWTNEGSVGVQWSPSPRWKYRNTYSDGRGAQPWLSTQLLLPCIGISESDSKLHTNFELCERKNLKHLKNTSIYNFMTFTLKVIKFIFHYLLSNTFYDKF